MDIKSIGVIDTDSHIVERPEHYKAYIEDGYQVPQVVADKERGTEYWVINGELVPRPIGAAGPGVFKGLIQHYNHPQFGKVVDVNGLTPSSKDGALDDIEGRIKDMDIIGIKTQVLNPTIGIQISMIKDSRTALALCKAYNNYVSSKLKGQSRIKANYIVPLQNVEDAIDELKRIVRLDGFAGIAVPPIVTTDGNIGLSIKATSDPSFDEFWKEVSKLKVPVTFHSLSSLPLPWIILGKKYLYSRMFTHTTSMQWILTTMIGEGYFDRYPDLKILLAEAGATWIPHWLFYLEEQYEHPSLKLEEKYMHIKELPEKRPLEYFKAGNIYVSVEAEEPTDILRYIIDKMGIGSQLVFATDYGHEEMDLKAVEKFVEHQKSLGENDLKQIMSANGSKFYGLNE